jgi:hypothetical protein
VRREEHERAPEPATLSKRLLWFAVLWCAGVAAVALAGLAIRAVLLGSVRMVQQKLF